MSISQQRALQCAARGVVCAVCGSPHHKQSPLGCRHPLRVGVVLAITYQGITHLYLLSLFGTSVGRLSLTSEFECPTQLSVPVSVEYEPTKRDIALSLRTGVDKSVRVSRSLKLRREGVPPKYAIRSRVEPLTPRRPARRGARWRRRRRSRPRRAAAAGRRWRRAPAPRWRRRPAAPSRPSS